MKLISLNVGLPRLTLFRGQTINTGIFKQPVEGPVHLRTLNLDGDRQADLAVHGGPFKAVYGYPSEHYPFWREELPGMPLPWGMFGENFTTEGLFESDLHIGDRLQVGSAVITVRQPRIPCYKLAAKFHRTDVIARFLRSGRSGFYFSVEREGIVQSGDSFELLSHEKYGYHDCRDESSICSGCLQQRFDREGYRQHSIAGRLAQPSGETAVGVSRRPGVSSARHHLSPGTHNFTENALRPPMPYNAA